jgi:hypothetical protein
MYFYWYDYIINCEVSKCSTDSHSKQESAFVRSCEESVDEDTREETRCIIAIISTLFLIFPIFYFHFNFAVMGWDALHWGAFKGDNKMVSDIIQSRKKNESDLQQGSSFYIIRFFPNSFLLFFAVFKQDLAGVSPLHLAGITGIPDNLI